MIYRIVIMTIAMIGYIMIMDLIIRLINKFFSDDNNNRPVNPNRRYNNSITWQDPVSGRSFVFLGDALSDQAPCNCRNCALIQNHQQPDYSTFDRTYDASELRGFQADYSTFDRAYDTPQLRVFQPDYSTFDRAYDTPQLRVFQHDYSTFDRTYDASELRGLLGGRHEPVNFFPYSGAQFGYPGMAREDRQEDEFEYEIEIRIQTFQA